MSAAPYVVRRGAEYLRLVGPFCYPAWTTSLAEAERMTFGLAHQCASAFGGTVAHVDSTRPFAGYGS